MTALIGSANFTNAALTRSCENGGNIEVCLIAKDVKAKAVRTALNSKDISAMPIELDKIVPMQIEPRETKCEDSDIRLYHAEIDRQQNTIITNCEIDGNSVTSDFNYSLLIKQIGSMEPDTICNLKKVISQKGILEFILEPEDISILNKATTVAIHATKNNKEFTSNYVWLLNVVEIYESIDKNNRKIEKQFMESGKGLVDFINEYIQQGMIDKAIDLLRRLRIKFDNGSGRVHTRPILSSPSSPITDDDIPQSLWLLTSDQRIIFGGTIKDFIDQHFKMVLKKHLAKPNLNGIPNFLDVLETCADLGLMAMKNKIMSSSEVHSQMLSGFHYFSGNLLQQGYFRELFCKFFEVKNKLNEILKKHQTPERIIAYCLFLKSIEPASKTKTNNFIGMNDIYNLTTVDYISHFFDFVTIDDTSLSSRIDRIVTDYYDNSEFCKLRFDNSIDQYGLSL